MFGKIYFKITGLNFNKFLTLLKKQNIQIYKMKKIEYNIFFMGVSKSNENKFLEICKQMNYDVAKTSQSFMPKITQYLKHNIAFVMSLVIILIALSFCCNMVFKVEVYGLENITKNQIIQVLNKNGYVTGKFKNSYNLQKLEATLKQNINNISFASATIKGNTLIINVNEKIDNSNLLKEYEPLLSPYDIVIKQIKLKSGTAVVHNGDVVKKGEPIVMPYILGKDGSKLNVEASAEITGDVQLTITESYMENHLVWVNSGKKQEQVNFSIFSLNLGTRGQTPAFKKYQTETKICYNFKNFFLPIKQTKYVYLELVEKQVYVPFNKVAQNIIEQNQNMLYTNLVVKSKENVKYETTTNFFNNTYFVTTCLTASVVF